MSISISVAMVTRYTLMARTLDVQGTVHMADRIHLGLRITFCWKFQEEHGGHDAHSGQTHILAYIYMVARISIVVRICIVTKIPIVARIHLQVRLKRSAQDTREGGARI
jgi:hypothetical protein